MPLHRFLLIPLLFLSTCLYAQQNAINDPHGDKESLAKLNDQKIKGDLVMFTDAGSHIKVPKTRIIEIPLVSFTNTYSIFQKDSTRFQVTLGKFIPQKHKIGYTKIDGDAKFVSKIDGNPFFGTDGELPRSQINSITAIIGLDTIRIPNSAFNDLFESGLSYIEKNKTMGFLRVYASSDRSRYYIHMGNGDGAGFYEVTFIIKDRKYFRRVIDYGF